MIFEVKIGQPHLSDPRRIPVQLPQRCPLCSPPVQLPLDGQVLGAIEVLLELPLDRPQEVHQDLLREEPDEEYHDQAKDHEATGSARLLEEALDGEDTSGLSCMHTPPTDPLVTRDAP